MKITKCFRRSTAMFFVFFLTFHIHGMVNKAVAQEKQEKDSSYILVRASEKYNKSAGYQKRWGKHYRTEWYTPVSFRMATLDTLAGGLTVYQQGGGRQSKSLRLRDKNGREYVLRSIDKSFGKALPEIALGTFIEKIVDDQVTIGHPYSALTIASMAEAAGIFHTNPVIYYMPKHSSLGQFSDSMGNALYLFEQRPDENWETAGNFGNAKNIVGTDKMLEKLYEDNDVSLDQPLFVRSRLFDMFIGDWGRHEDQWRWGAFKDGGKTVYKPIPRDRDQAYTLFDGNRLKLVMGIAGIKHLQTFDHTIRDINTYNFPARNLDYHLTNQISPEQWVSIANDLKMRLTDEVIDNAIKMLPPEVYNISGPGIASKLKSRRNLLTQFARDYSLILTKETEITGSEDTELFDVRRSSDTTTEINIYKITNEGEVKKKPFYHRIFNNRQTSQIRIYGLDGKDQYKVSGNVTKGIDIKLIGGPDTDTFLDESNVSKGGKMTMIYDDRKNEIKTSGETRLRLSSDSAIHAFKWDIVKYNKRSIRPIAFYNNEDRIYVGLALKSIKHKWRKEPYGSMNYIDVKYSIAQNAFSTTYENHIPQFVGKWDLLTQLNYDLIRWTNYYGLGNNSIRITDDRDYYRTRSREAFAELGVSRNFRNKHRISLMPYFQTVKIITDTARYLYKSIPHMPIIPPGETVEFETQSFAGARISYIYQSLNDSILPTKGIGFIIGADYTANLKHNDRSFTRYNAELNIYLPVTRSLGIFIKGGGSTLAGDPEFYQYNRLGGSRTLRGYERDRLYGNSTFYNQNEIRLISDVRSFLFNGKVGIFGLYDIGRVWLDKETSNKWHYGYGGGIILSPFNRISVSAAYAVSGDDTQIHLRVMKVLRY